MLKRVLNFREWNLLAQVVWSGSLILMLFGLKEVFEASDLPVSVRYIAAFASIPVFLIGSIVMVMSSDAWGRRKFGDQFGRGWSRRERHRPEGEDQKEAADLSTIRLVVDQEMFEVSERAGVPGQYDFDWLSGPNKSYGFTSATSDGSPETVEDLEDAIRDFLTMIDPETGYISDDEDDDLRDPSKPPLGWPPDSSTGDRA